MEGLLRSPVDDRRGLVTEFLATGGDSSILGGEVEIEPRARKSDNLLPSSHTFSVVVSDDNILDSDPEPLSGIWVSLVLDFLLIRLSKRCDGVRSGVDVLDSSCSRA